MDVDMKRARIEDGPYDTKKCCMIRLHGFGRVSGEQTPAEHSVAIHVPLVHYRNHGNRKSISDPLFFHIKSNRGLCLFTFLLFKNTLIHFTT